MSRDVEIARHPNSTTSEGWVERICPHGGGAEVHMTLADGTATSARLRADEVEWLELGVNQIVNVLR